MFLHLGGDVIVHKKDIIAIFDISSTLKAKNSKLFLEICNDEGFIQQITNEEPRSFVITERVVNCKKTGKKDIKTIVYYSPISALTLQKRAVLNGGTDKY
ncbi:DUF370 domain-containing protein [Alkaliphilus pronyensis]|uniref:DUF370 domain-containing protein n=1 Tax=Alkaliphilus pronyensis TaxID=1482732 RepID=A0A6I0F9K2_9FIRM|nr:extracellular matrix/biofilm biosynthesis regulator RemA family protein [Alkaliphilus pronyensis]KAB3533825.1 DUF370 domain-containing protein [Alkaliphilus pronyensis]